MTKLKTDQELITEAATEDVLQKKGVLKKFAKFTGKRLCQSLFFNKDEGVFQ